MSNIIKGAIAIFVAIKCVEMFINKNQFKNGHCYLETAVLASKSDW